ncbi:Protein aurora borealis [Camelus dromedarius]|uniref:Protein aurora borealis n=1 Tax=Camelus dromedarius TaxID=9838 RepID=A0A5N4D9J7_CAMDR|nr:Protein aurora borealis [Camelus dromedarius]
MGAAGEDFSLCAMGDVKESKMQITPETPGRIPVLNPFESPGDYSNLHEQTVSSPSVFKSTKLPLTFEVSILMNYFSMPLLIRSLSFVKTPGEFRWSIDQLAVINPVEIDPEDIHRQALYLSRSRIDKDVEDKRQKAIEEFFTKDVIVPSPWTDHEGKQLSEYHSSKCECTKNHMNKNHKNKTHYNAGYGGSIDTEIVGIEYRAELVMMFAVIVKVNFFNEILKLLSANLLVSSNGISINNDSPTERKLTIHSEKSNAACQTLLSLPVDFNLEKVLEQRKFTSHSPDASSGTHANGIANPCIRSPYIDGCSPIKNWSPMRLEVCGGGAQYRTSLIRIPFTLEAPKGDEDDGADDPSADVPPLSAGGHLPQLDGAASPRGPRLVVTALSITHSQPGAAERELALLQEGDSGKENVTVDMVDPVEIAEETAWIKEPGDNGSPAMTEFVSGIAFSIENSHMCMSPLAESSVIPCESSNIQMDSGYNTQNCGSNIMDTVGAESYDKENDAQTLEVETKSQVFNTKQDHPTQRYWMKTANPPQCSSP